MTEGEELSNAVKAAYEKHRYRLSVSPAWLATQAMVQIGFGREAHRLAYAGCHQHLRAIARQYCRHAFDPTDPVDPTTDLFPDTLQERYPLKPRAGEEPRYVLLDRLPDDDLAYNVKRMRRASSAMSKHADTLESYGVNRRRTYGTVA